VQHILPMLWRHVLRHELEVRGHQLHRVRFEQYEQLGDDRLSYLGSLLERG
jgi:hypothetical protein